MLFSNENNGLFLPLSRQYFTFFDIFVEIVIFKKSILMRILF